MLHTANHVVGRDTVMSAVQDQRRALLLCGVVAYGLSVPARRSAQRNHTRTEDGTVRPTAQCLRNPVGQCWFTGSLLTMGLPCRGLG